MYSDNILLSIITVTFNAEKEVKKTIQSVLSQKDYPIDAKLEMVFIDGKSTDQTVSVIQHFIPLLEEKQISVRLISESDSGIYDAMNKGIKHAHGTWIQMLNAGDCLYNSHIFRKILPKMIDSEAGVLYGDFIKENEFTSRISKTPPLPELRGRIIFCHQSVFIRRDINIVNLYDTKYKLSADYKLLLKLYLEGIKFEYVPLCIVSYDLTGVSAKRMVEAYRECHHAREELKVIDNRVKDYCVYIAGISKLTILNRMPQALRWKIYHAVKGRKKNDYE